METPERSKENRQSAAPQSPISPRSPRSPQSPQSPLLPNRKPRKFYLTKSRQNSIDIKNMAGAVGNRDESFVHVSDAPKTCDITAHAEDNPSRSNLSETASVDQSASQVQKDVSFAEALKEDTNGREVDNDHQPEQNSLEKNDGNGITADETERNGHKEDQDDTHGEKQENIAQNGNNQPSVLVTKGELQRGNGKQKQQERDDSDLRSDDSYPELDEMSIKETHAHQPLHQHEPYSKIRWAPFNVPAKRRLQTLAVLMHCLSIGALVSVFFAFCANPFAWPLLLVYLMHLLTSNAATDGSLKYRSEWFRRIYLWDLFAGYFPARLHKTQDLPPTRKYIFGYHPHGIISHGAWAAFATEALGFAEKFPGITNSLLTLDSNFRIPLYRDYVLAMGVRSVSKDSIANILTRGGSNNEGMGRAVTIVIGGARESLEAQPGQMRLILKERKGFIKLAVRTGADLVPVLAFGENDLYDQLRPKEHPIVHKIQMFVLKVWKFTLPFLHGRGVFNYDVGLMPYRHPLNVVVGAPIKVQQSKRVDEQEVDRLHELYVEELLKLWNRYKDEFLPDRQEDLEIL